MMVFIFVERLWLSTSGAKLRPFDVTSFSLAVSYNAVDEHGQYNTWIDDPEKLLGNK